MWRKSKPYLMIMPVLTLILLLFVGGLGLGILQSLGYFPVLGQLELSLRAYETLIEQDQFWESLSLSLRTAFLSTLLSSFLGLGAALLTLLWKKEERSVGWVWQRLFLFPLLIPHLVVAYLMVLLFMQSGWISRVIYSLGIIEDMTQFPVLIHEPMGWGIIFAYVWKETPFVALLLFPVIQRIRDSWQEAARMLGANTWMFLKEIVIPLLMPAWLAASFIVFAFTFTAFEMPYLLGVTYPEMISVYGFRLYTGSLSERPEAMALNVIITVISVGLGYAAYRLSKRWSLREGKGWA
ncbi:ABC transporter permease [Ammoniphilus sp. CFH 90114]|uniref:ABC transporter permease n=1 Tax=Ammoniphilus sp. CFH 90114 TaxID=2493665 RepID=UPI00100E773B|nr:ABC transporter permease subunit [Ammoniphilus sp. CFH 90114]RXT13736.1 ABC transporter permease subunit [Ammoniphilus sp. CFH 90114]